MTTKAEIDFISLKNNLRHKHLNNTCCENQSQNFHTAVCENCCLTSPLKLEELGGDFAPKGPSLRKVIHAFDLSILNGNTEVFFGYLNEDVITKLIAMGLEVTLEKGLIKVSVSRKFQENLGPVENPKDKEKPVPKIFNDEENASLEEWMEFVRTWGLNSRICEAAFQKIPLTKFSMNLLKKTYPYASLISSLIKEFITLKASFEQKATVGPWVILKVCFEDNLNTEDQKKLEKLFLDAINSYPINL